jgi:hypothetical protein
LRKAVAVKSNSATLIRNTQAAVFGHSGVAHDFLIWLRHFSNRRVASDNEPSRPQMDQSPLIPCDVDRYAANE